MQWLRDGLRLIRSSNEVEALANSVPDNGGVYIVPAFVGLGTPHWDQYARGSIFGLTRATTAGHLARAALESIAFQVADLLDAMQRDTGIPLPELRVDGGAAANETLLQFQADILGIPVVRPAVMETTALGVAYMAGLAVAFWHDADAIAAMPSKKSASSRVCPGRGPSRFVHDGIRRCHVPKGGTRTREGEPSNALRRANSDSLRPSIGRGFNCPTPGMTGQSHASGGELEQIQFLLGHVFGADDRTLPWLQAADSISRQ